MKILSRIFTRTDIGTHHKILLSVLSAVFLALGLYAFSSDHPLLAAEQITVAVFILAVTFWPRQKQ